MPKGIIKDTSQHAQNPGEQGRGQSQQVPTHEGSQLNQPSKAQVISKNKAL